MPDFWRHSGFHLNTIAANGVCVPTDDLLRAYFGRAEVAPIADSCTAERDLFERLMLDPRLEVGRAELDRLADPDARANYAIVLRFRDHLLDTGSLEAAYKRLFVDESGAAADFAARGLPPMFADQLVQMIMRNILDGCDNGMHARAAELFFREQRAHIEDDQVVLADSETVASLAQNGADASEFGNIGRLLAQARATTRPVELAVLTETNAHDYWSKDERHDMALQVNFGRPGLAALCRIIELWVMHFFQVAVRVEPIRSLESARMRWFVGLDAVSTVLMNDIYNGVEPDEGLRRRIICMMRLKADRADSDSADEPETSVYLALCMDKQGNVRMKPQNLLVNLPFRRRL